MEQHVSLLHDELGSAAIEYGLLVGLIAVASIAALTAFGEQIAVNYTTFTASMADASS